MSRRPATTNPGTTDQRPSGPRLTTAILAATLIAAAVGVVGPAFTASPADAATPTLPAGFVDTTVFQGLKNPTVIQFSSDGRVWVGQQNGQIYVYNSLSSTTPTLFADLNQQVENWWDRGLLGLVLDPQFPTRPYVYVQYTYNAPPGGTAPRWPSDPNDPTTDTCPDPPGGTTDGCVVQGRVRALTVSNAGAGDTMVPGSETVLVQDWCDQFPSHSIGTLAFGPDGYLYAGGGDGASFYVVDQGQFGGSLPGTPTPKNPCGDGPGEGGALRAQSVRTPASAAAPATLDGSIIRIDPTTGAAAPGGPFAGRADPKERMIIAHGLRNPFRFTFRPGTSELWSGDVGWNDVEELDRIPNTASTTAANFGWPCYEGPTPQPGYQAANLSLCNSLTSAAVTPPYFSYTHQSPVLAGDGCGQAVSGAIASSTTGVAFYTPPSGAGAKPYPAAYNNALFFTDYDRQCIWAMKTGTNGLPDPTKIERFASLSALGVGAVDLVTGPGGDLFWVDLFGGTIHRISYPAANQAPVPSLVASATSGAAPLTVTFDAGGSTDPEGNTPLSYSWDLDGNGTFGDSTLANPSATYTAVGPVTVSVRVTDSLGASAVATKVISVGNTAPIAAITSPAQSTNWRVGDVINFGGSANDAQDGPLAPSRLNWRVRLLTCGTANNCITRYEQTYAGVASGSYTAPDWAGAGNNVLEFQLTATDSGGLTSTSTVQLTPQTATLSLASSPSGLQVGVGSEVVTTPWSGTVIVNSTNSLAAVSPQVSGTTSYVFDSWSDGGDASHVVTTPAGGRSVAVNYKVSPVTVLPAPSAGGWKLNGSALLSGTSLELTPVSPTNQSGTAIYPTAVPSAALTVDFDEFTGGGTGGGDGLTFALLPTTTATSATGANGGGLGWAGLGGVAVALDTWQNWGSADPSANFAGIATGYSTATDNITYVQTATGVGTIRGATRHVRITTAGGHLKVSIDGVAALDSTAALPANAYLAFTAGTGDSTDRHAISNVVIQSGSGGTAPAPVVGYSATSLAFGTTTIGQPVTRPLTLTNTGTAPAQITALVTPGAPFALSGAVANGATIPVGGSIAETVTYTPTSAVTSTGSLTITTNDGTGPHAISLTGTGQAPAAGILITSSTAVAFGTVTVGTTATKTLTVSNTGNAPLSVTTVTGPAAPFAATGLSSGATIAAGASVTLTTTFTPTAAVASTGSITLTTTGGNATITVGGTGQAAGSSTAVPSPVSGTGWSLNGSTVVNGTSLDLTPASANKLGTAITTSTVSTANLTIDYDVSIAGGNGGDGLTFALLPATTASTAQGTDGGCLGWGGLGGVAVALDTYQNWNASWTAAIDPSNNFVGIATGANTTNQNLVWAATSTAVPALRGTSRHVKITTAGGHLRVSVGGTQYLDSTTALPATAKLAFTAATGSNYDRHSISNVVITAA